MEDLKFRTISREELEAMCVADEHKSERIKNVFQIIGASFLCIISLAFIAVFIFLLKFENFGDAPKTFYLSNIKFVNTLCWYGQCCALECRFICLIALIIAFFNILFKSHFIFLFRKIPLGSFNFLQTPTITINRIAEFTPTLLISIMIIIRQLGIALIPDFNAIYAKYLMPIACIIIAIFCILLVINLAHQGGIYAILLRGTMISIANFGLSATFRDITHSIRGFFPSVIFLAIYIYIIIRITSKVRKG